MSTPKTQHVCQVHKTHSPKPLVIVKHHIQPLGMGGPDEESNWLWVCDTGHRNIHTLMGPLANKGVQPKQGTVLERQYAIEGVNRWIVAGRPGDSHAAYALANPHSH